MLAFDVNLAHADAAFIEEAVVLVVLVVLEEVTILGSMGALSRREEVAGIETELRRHGLAERFERLAAPATLEGGDVLGPPSPDASREPSSA